MIHHEKIDFTPFEKTLNRKRNEEAITTRIEYLALYLPKVVDGGVPHQPQPDWLPCLLIADP